VDKHRNVFEFDFKAFFNTISPSVVYECIATKSKLLADLVFSVIKDIRYVYDELKPEAELKKKIAWD
jgi:ammonia channel protein AmtB